MTKISFTHSLIHPSTHLLDDKLKEECGVIGVFSQNQINIFRLIHYGLYALQHRGQESAGIAITHNGFIDYHKDMGLVSEVFNDNILEKLELKKGNIGIGHIRYSTTGESHIENAQPLVVKYKNSSIALAHNGNLINANTMKKILEDDGVVFQSTTDSEVIINLLARYNENGIEKSVKKVMEIIKGSYAFVIITENKLLGIRDPYGLKPLCIGKREGGYVLSSESAALDTLDAKFIRDVEPGEIVIITKEGLQSIKSDKSYKKSLCIFEIIYFARPDSIMDGINVYLSRYKAGKILAKEAPVDADIVIGVPHSGIAAAIGYADESAIPYGKDLIKNGYIGRTFIQPNQKLREEGVKIKLNVLKEDVKGKKVVIIDDSIVRGTTSIKIVDIFRKAGAKEVHLRVSSPPIKYSCHFGIDTPYRKHLIGAINTIEQIREMLNADSLAYISMEGLLKSIEKDSGFCLACLNGDYPMEIPKVS